MLIVPPFFTFHSFPRNFPLEIFLLFDFYDNTISPVPPIFPAAHSLGLFLSYPDNPALKCSSVFCFGLLLQSQQLSKFPAISSISFTSIIILLYLLYYYITTHIYIPNPKPLLRIPNSFDVSKRQKIKPIPDHTHGLPSTLVF